MDGDHETYRGSWLSCFALHHAPIDMAGLRHNLGYSCELENALIPVRLQFFSRRDSLDMRLLY